MKLPAVVKNIRDRFVTAYPLPFGMPGPEFEERVRQWSIRLAEQVRFETNDPAWGVKRADPGRPIGKDTIARFEEGRLLIWDLCLGAGTGAPRLNADPDSEDVTGQVFIGVAPVNHLKVEPPRSAPAPQEAPAPQNAQALAAVMAKLEAIEGLARQHLDGQTALEAAYQATTENLAALSRQLEAMRAEVVGFAERPVTVPDADFRIGNRTVGKIDFPDPNT